MKIYTRSGDKGTTSLVGGKRVPKSNPRIEAYGTVDELICHIGLLRDQVSKENYQPWLIRVQDRLMICAAILASDCEDCRIKIPGNASPVIKCERLDGIQFHKLLDKVMVSGGLLFRDERMQRPELRPAEMKQLCCSVQFHGTGPERDHGRRKRQIPALQPRDVPHEFGL